MNTKTKAIVASLVSLMVLAAMVGAVSARINTIASSTMIFNGTLTDNNDGTYTGTVPMINESALNIGDYEAGFDVYAKNGAKATYDKVGSGTNYACGAVATHDAYTTAGGWGVTCDPDCADWYHYQLNFTDDHWYLEYYTTGGGAVGYSMSGTMDWANMYAAETDPGTYYSGMGTPESAGYALNNPCTGTNDGSAAWDMDWTWGSEYIPLQYPGFTVTVTGSGNYEVTLKPARARSTQTVEVDVPNVLSMAVSPSPYDYGTVSRGACSGTNPNGPITVTNDGDVDLTVTVSALGIWTNIDYYNTTAASWENANDFQISPLNDGASQNVATNICIPDDNQWLGPWTGVVTWEYIAAP